MHQIVEIVFSRIARKDLNSSKRWRKLIYKLNASHGGVFYGGIWQHRFHFTTFSNSEYEAIGVMTEFERNSHAHTSSKKWKSFQEESR